MRILCMVEADAERLEPNITKNAKLRARKYTHRIINSLGIKSEEFLISDQISQAVELGRIHAKVAWFLARVLFI